MNRKQDWISDNVEYSEVFCLLYSLSSYLIASPPLATIALFVLKTLIKSCKCLLFLFILVLYHRTRGSAEARLDSPTHISTYDYSGAHMLDESMKESFSPSWCSGLFITTIIIEEKDLFVF